MPIDNGEYSSAKQLNRKVLPSTLIHGGGPLEATAFDLDPGSPLIDAGTSTDSTSDLPTSIHPVLARCPTQATPWTYPRWIWIPVHRMTTGCY